MSRVILPSNMELLPFTDAPLTNAQCLLCSSSSLTSYLDLTSVTSRTSHSETPVKDKVKNILKDKWIPSLSDPSCVMCLPCFRQIDQLDNLETQLRVIQEEICKKYVDSHSVVHTLIHLEGKFVVPNEKNEIQTVNGDKEIKLTPSKRHSVVIPKRGPSEYALDELSLPMVQVDDMKKGRETEILLEWQPACLDEFESGMAPGNQLLVTSLPPSSTLTMAWIDGDEPSLRTVPVESNASDSLVQEAVDDPTVSTSVDTTDVADEEEDKASSTVYDSIEQFKPGERIRVGTTASPEAAPGAVNCSYCDLLFLDTKSLKLHFRCAHNPVILTANLPLHLGLGPHANCGVQISNISVSNQYAKPFICIFCDGAFKFKSNIHAHYRDKHSPHKPFTCQDCQESFRKSIELSRHRVYHCRYCEKSRPRTERKNAR